LFAHSTAIDPLAQGDIIEDCPLVGLNLAVLPFELNDPATKWWTARVIVLTQECDLAQTLTSHKTNSFRPETSRGYASELQPGKRSELPGRFSVAACKDWAGFLRWRLRFG
jgi:hypothetical protein